MLKMFPIALMLLYFSSNLAMADGGHLEPLAQVTDQKAFKLLKEKSINPKTGLPKTLDPDLFKGKTKKAYEVAKEIPEILAKMPCFCGCEVYGHENLLDCFIDNHGAG